jgi:hypothetical protein
MKETTKCPLVPCPSQIQNNLIPNGNFWFIIYMSWFILVILPFEPAFVLIDIG